MGTTKKKTSLGKALLRDRFQRNPNQHINMDGMVKNSHERDKDLEVDVNMRSITEENDLDAFLASAELAGTDFTAERLNVSIIQTTQGGSTTQNSTKNPFLLSREEEKETLRLHSLHRNALTIPRRPRWTKETTADALHTLEKSSFLDWRRGLVYLEEEKGLILTPYERNLEVWRQLWRVIERSELVVQIVDGRNINFFWSKDLGKYVEEVGKGMGEEETNENVTQDDIEVDNPTAEETNPKQRKEKRNLLLVNKADMLTVSQRVAWAKYFKEQGIEYTFFSAALAREQQDQEEEEGEGEGEGKEDNEREMEEETSSTSHSPPSSSSSTKSPSKKFESEFLNLDMEESVPEEARILGALELVELLESLCPESDYSLAHGKRTIGFVGYPNVGKSSTLNALVGATKVAVGSTPGKTKHFQTIHLSDKLVLCDCPGLVFPSFATTKAEMVVNGVLPIDQLREHIGPAGLIAQRIPKYYLEAIYGISIRTRNVEGELQYRNPTAEELLVSYAVGRGYTKSSQGNPDEARAARFILKDYVNGKLLYVVPPPGYDPENFNLEIYQDERMLAKQIKKLNLSMIQEKIAASTIESRQTGDMPVSNSRSVDSDFFNKKEIRARTNGNSRFASNDFTRVQSFPFQEGYSSTATAPSNKKSHKKEKRVKHHVNWTKQTNE